MGGEPVHLYVRSGTETPNFRQGGYADLAVRDAVLCISLQCEHDTEEPGLLCRLRAQGPAISHRAEKRGDKCARHAAARYAQCLSAQTDEVSSAARRPCLLSDSV